MTRPLARSLVVPLPGGSAARDIFERQPYWLAGDLRDEPLAEEMGLASVMSTIGIRNTLWVPLQISRERVRQIERGAGCRIATLQRHRGARRRLVVLTERDRVPVSRERRRRSHRRRWPGGRSRAGARRGVRGIVEASAQLRPLVRTSHARSPGEPRARSG